MMSSSIHWIEGGQGVFTVVTRMPSLNCLSTFVFDNVDSHRPAAPYGDQRIGINHVKSSKNRKGTTPIQYGILIKIGENTVHACF